MAPHEGDFKGQVPPKRMRPMLGHPPLSMVRNRGPPVSPIGRCWSVRTKLKAKRHNPHASTGRRFHTRRAMDRGRREGEEE